MASDTSHDFRAVCGYQSKTGLLLRPKERKGAEPIIDRLSAKRRPEFLTREPYCLGNASVSSDTGLTRFRRRDWFYTATQIQPALQQSQVDLIRKVLPPGSIRIGYGEVSVHHRHVCNLLGLHASSWPSFHDRPAWPSTPTFNEWLEMIRFGDSPVGPIRDNATVAVSLRRFNTDIELARKIIRRQIIGIRSDIAVPEKFWGYFRYRWNFLILTSPYALPAGLARFLAGVWCTDPYSLWLERKVTLKQYLREVPRSALRRRETIIPMEPKPSLVSTVERVLTSPALNPFDFESYEDSVSSFDDSF